MKIGAKQIDDQNMHSQETKHNLPKEVVQKTPQIIDYSARFNWTKQFC